MNKISENTLSSGFETVHPSFGSREQNRKELARTKSSKDARKGEDATSYCDGHTPQPGIVATAQHALPLTFAQTLIVRSYSIAL